ncbi:hypothetical protein [Sphingomonas abaci]|uniref:Glyceraldehyde-3-phosphate dehydrogenase/erythrose-4-phosphate dehydrogenase n=1 Tax=Sphingomonas abaci TaxID=237611 RepID=A0A7W7AMI0_9SPHN|nr:hypothetical protein [Sphingomonas abaci]MBB4618870.1 glyceraldehyde-3-phosphate dehydrogenase/erythrose-4-phosphate dehydrogenase [Sphingomonas abaci]
MSKIPLSGPRPFCSVVRAVAATDARADGMRVDRRRQAKAIMLSLIILSHAAEAVRP